MVDYKFTNDWFKNSELRKELSSFLSPNGINRMLEIGSYEGASACFFSDDYLDHSESFLICVDPFATGDTTSPVSISTKDSFYSNIKLSKNTSKVVVKEQYSHNFFEDNHFLFNFIYIDGSHLPDDITKDFNNSLKVIKSGGIIWMDDYGGGSDGGIAMRAHVDALFLANSDKLDLIHKGYQIAFKFK